MPVGRPGHAGVVALAVGLWAACAPVGGDAPGDVSSLARLDTSANYGGPPPHPVAPAADALGAAVDAVPELPEVLPPVEDTSAPPDAGATDDIPKPPPCDDGDPCTKDALTPLGCSHSLVLCPLSGTPCIHNACIGQGCTAVFVKDAPCSDGDGCTTGDTCAQGECVASPVVCDDDLPCFVLEGCLDGHCRYHPAACDDGDPCTDDACTNGACAFSPKVCDDGDLCTHSSCEGGVCKHQPVVCDDGDLCTWEICHLGACLSKPLPCVAGPGFESACYFGVCVTTFPACSAEEVVAGTCESAGPMVSIAGGPFLGGRPLEEPAGWLSLPPGLRWLDVEPFQIDRFEVTSRQYAAFLAMVNNVCTHPIWPDIKVPCYDCQDGGPIACVNGYIVPDVCRDRDGALESCDAHPVVEVTWVGAHNYCAIHGRRLPTMVEWERAVRGPTPPGEPRWRRYPWSVGCVVDGPLELATATQCPTGDECPTSFTTPGYPDPGCTGIPWTAETARLNCAEPSCADGYTGTAPVGTFPSGSSVEGVMDLYGNVGEWVDDSAGSTYDNAALPGSATSDVRFTKGVTYYGVGYGIDATGMGVGLVNLGSAHVGFRCAK